MVGVNRGHVHPSLASECIVARAPVSNENVGGKRGRKKDGKEKEGERGLVYA